jgi:hypothetical protein
MEPSRNRFPAWQAGTTNLFDVPGLQAIKAGRIDSLESIPGLLRPYQIPALVRQSFFAGSGTAHSSIQDTACKLYVTQLKDFIYTQEQSPLS